MAGLWCVAIGYGRTEVAEAMAAQSRRLAFYHTFTSMSNEPQIRLADRLLALAPGRMSKVFFGTSGSEANDTQVKLVWYYNNLRGRPGKKKIIARRQGFHGTTVAAASLTGIEAFHRAFDLPLPQILHTSPAYHYRYAEPGQSEEDYASALAAELEQLIEREGPETVAAFIAEPVMGAGGVVPPPRGYFEKVQRVLRRHDVLMIADEVICGFGRLGRMFGSVVYGIEPDLVTVAKQLTSGYFPLSACFVSEDIWNVLREGSPDLGPFAHGFTYSGHPVGAAAALANLDIVLSEDLVGNAARVGQYLQERLRDDAGRTSAGGRRAWGGPHRRGGVGRRYGDPSALRACPQGWGAHRPALHGGRAHRATAAGRSRHRAVTAALHHAGAGGLHCGGSHPRHRSRQRRADP